MNWKTCHQSTPIAEPIVSQSNKDPSKQSEVSACEQEEFGDSDDETISITNEDKQRLLNVTSILCNDSSESESSESDECDTDDNPGSDDETVSSSNASTDKCEGSQWVICSISLLMQLASGKCQEAHCEANRGVSYEVNGSCLQLNGICPNGHRFYWSSSKYHTNNNQIRMFESSLLLASVVVFSGNSFTKVKRLFDFMRLAIISPTTFYNYQRHFICPAVNKFYIQKQAKLLQQYRTTKLVLSGDGRCDSPGKSAKFCTYSVMESEKNQILHFENIDKREVALHSPNMEREGVIRCLDFLIAKGMKVTELITDSSTSVAKTLETKYPSVYHSRDVWHKAKKLKKALAEAGKVCNMGKLNQWSGNIVNHFWFCCRTCDGKSVKLKEKWLSLLHHVLNNHDWLLGKCDHQPLTGPPTDNNGKEISYFNQQEPAFRVLRKIITDKAWLKSLDAYTKFRHTGMLESFHSLLLSYCSKRTAYQNQAYLARVQLAVLDHNAHSEREAAVDKKGDQLYHRKYRKQSKNGMQHL